MTPVPLPAFQDNYIWLLFDDDHAVVVDPGCAQTTTRELQARGLSLSSVLLTHHHPDHTGGLPDLRQRWPQMQVVGPADPRIRGVDRVVDDGEEIDLGHGLRAQVMATPGHTCPHLSYLIDGWLFCGDTLFSLGCGRLFEGRPAQMLASLDRLAALPPDTAVCCTHEYTLANARFALAVDPDNPVLHARVEQARQQRQAGLPTLPVALASEIACNPFLGVDRAAVRKAAEAHAGRRLDDRVETFASLRAWKDGFA